MSGSERLLICDRPELMTRLDSEVRLGRVVSMPNPGVTASFRSGRISPNKRPAWRGGGDRGFGISAPVVGLVAGGGVGAAARGLDILLANDCELAGAWSSAASL